MRTTDARAPRNTQADKPDGRAADAARRSMKCKTAARKAKEQREKEALLRPDRVIAAPRRDFNSISFEMFSQFLATPCAACGHTGARPITPLSCVIKFFDLLLPRAPRVPPHRVTWLHFV